MFEEEDDNPNYIPKCRDCIEDELSTCNDETMILSMY